MLRRPAIFSTILFLGLHLFAGSPAEGAFHWYYAVTGPGGTGEVTIDEPGAIVYFQFDALTSDYVWGNVRIDFDPALLECVSIEETPYADGFWTAWITAPAEPAYGGGGSLYYYDSTGYGSDWAHYWVDQYGPMAAGPSGSYDNTLGIIRLYAITNAGGLNGSVPLRIGFRIKQTGTAVFHTYASAGESFSWRLEELPYRHVSTVKIIQQACVQPPSGMIGWWPGDGSATDLAGTNNGAPANGAAYADGKVAQAFSLNGSSYVRIPDNSTLDTPDGFTVDAWIYPIATNGAKVIASKWDDPTGQWSWIFKLHNDGSGRLRIEISNGNHNSLGDLRGTNALPVNTWSHVAATYDRATSKLRLYVNGNLDGEGSARYPRTAVNNSQTDILIGAGNGQIYPSAVEHFSGRIDEFELFNRALTAAEIQTLYTAGSAGKCKNRPPVAAAGADQTVELTSCSGASVTLDGSGSSDPDGDALTSTWTWPGGSASGTTPTLTLPYGATTVTLTVDDGKGGTSSDEVVINVVDTTAPVLSVSLSTNALWPPNHKYVTVAPSVTVQDACAESVVAELLSSASNEPDNGLGDGDAENDIVVNADGTLLLRAERSGTGSGRTYTLLYQATDQAGNSATSSAQVFVPRDMKKN